MPTSRRPATESRSRASRKRRSPDSGAVDASFRRESGQLRGPFTGHAEWKSKRIIAVNVQGITRKKKDFTSLPLAKIQTFSVETAGTFDLDAELELWFSGLGKVKFEFSGKTDVAYLNKLVAHHVL